MSTSTTILGLAGAFGAGSVIAAGVKSQFDRVEKFRDRQIEAAEAFLQAVAEVRQLHQDAHVVAARPVNPDTLTATHREYDSLREEALKQLGVVELTRPRISVTFSRRSVTERIRRWAPVEEEIRKTLLALVGENTALREAATDIFPPSNQRLADAKAKRDAAHKQVEKLAAAFNRAIRRRWRV